MSLRSNGSYIGPRPTGPSSTVASGIWDVRTAERQKRSGQWTTSDDPYFSSVSLLLHMDGSGSTFVDSSAYGRAVTANNGAAINSDSKFGTGAGLFDGSNDYLSVPDDGGFDFGTGDFTVECWVKRTNGGSICASSANGETMIATDVSGANLAIGRNLVAWDLQSSALSWGSDWHHVAACRSGTTLRLFFDGTVVATNSSSTQSYNCSSTWLVGARAAPDGLAQFFSGSIDEFRITKGIARYESTFTPPTAAFLGA